MNMKAFSLIQHKLIPTALIAGNIALVQLIYLLAKGDYNYILWATALCIISLVIGILRANKYLLLGGIISYSILVLSALIFLPA
jgi:hypothetical protein